MIKISIRKTADVEIKMRYALTESRDGGNRQRCSSLNGPRRAWSKDYY